MFSYSKTAVERAMKIQEVILRAMAKKITWWQAAEILGFSDRHVRRIRERYQEFGYESMFDRRRGQPSPKRVPLATVEKVLALYRDKYFDLNVRHFHEKLGAQHEIDLSYSWVKSVLQGAGLVARQRQRGVHRKRRPRRPLPGMLLHIDGSHHQWFQDERWYDLIVILDDATSEIYLQQRWIGVHHTLAGTQRDSELLPLYGSWLCALQPGLASNCGSEKPGRGQREVRSAKQFFTDGSAVLPRQTVHFHKLGYRWHSCRSPPNSQSSF
jgi:hypothetical protein